MTGYRSKFFRHECPRDGCYYDRLPCWDDLIAECFPRHIRPTDVDGMVEINGHFLFLEEKREGCGPDEGQRRALKRLAAQPHTTIVLFRPGRASDLEVLTFVGKRPGTGWQPMTRAAFKAELRSWSSQSDAGEATA